MKMQQKNVNKKTNITNVEESKPSIVQHNIKHKKCVANKEERKIY
jgi:hypothetical protein